MPLIHKPHTKEYDAYFSSQAWIDKSNERRKLDGWRCCVCGKPSNRCKYGLQVHHLIYDNLGHEDVLHDIVSLCGTCHKKIHQWDAVTFRKACRAAGHIVYGNDEDYIGMTIWDCMKAKKERV